MWLPCKGTNGMKNITIKFPQKNIFLVKIVKYTKNYKQFLKTAGRINLLE